MKKAGKVLGKVWKWIRGVAGAAVTVVSPTKKAGVMWKIILVMVAVAGVVLVLKAAKTARVKAESDATRAKADLVLAGNSLLREQEVNETLRLALKNKDTSEKSSSHTTDTKAKDTGTFRMITEADGRSMLEYVWSIETELRDARDEADRLSQMPKLPIPVVKSASGKTPCPEIEASLTLPGGAIVKACPPSRYPIGVNVMYGWRGLRGGADIEFGINVPFSKRVVYFAPGLTVGSGELLGTTRLSLSRRSK